MSPSFWLCLYGLPIVLYFIGFLITFYDCFDLNKRLGGTGEPNFIDWALLALSCLVFWPFIRAAIWVLNLKGREE